MLNRADLVAISDTWLNEQIDSSFVSITGYDLYRLDRLSGRGGGVCAFVSNNIPCKQRLDLKIANYECMWLWLRPYRLPRPLSAILIAVLYCPPDTCADKQREFVHYLSETIDCVHYLSETIDCVRDTSPDCGIIVLGDYNNLDVSDLLNQQNLIQVMKDPTRHNATLDLVVTNMQSWYNEQTVIAPIGGSDHNTVLWYPKGVTNTTPDQKKLHCFVCRFPQSSIGFGRWLTHQEWSCDYTSTSVHEQTLTFTNTILQAMDIFFPFKSVKLYNSDKPWMCSSLKKLILDRQNAFHSDNMPLWKHYRNKVKQAIIIQKQTFYSEKVCHLKQTEIRLWWKLVKRLSGNTKATTSFHIEKNGSILNDQELVNELNEFFISVSTDIPPLNLHNLPAFLPAIDQLPTIQPYQVCNKLLKLNIMKASGPDNIPSEILKTFAYILAEPITDILNVSLLSDVVPEIWKQANISSIPKESPP